MSKQAFPISVCQGYGNKGITLYDIRAELSCRYKDLRAPYRPPNTEEVFNLLTKETPETFYIGRHYISDPAMDMMVLNCLIRIKKPFKIYIILRNPLLFISSLPYLYIGKLITSVVTGIAHRRPQGESYDQAIRNDETGLWQCPFCQQDNFPELSEVWHILFYT